MTSLSNEYPGFSKIPRLSRDMVVAEKIDGTNAQIEISLVTTIRNRPVYNIRAGSKNRWLTEEDDNYGFCKWVIENSNQLMGLGIGNHFGEWWGQGIGRGYGMRTRLFSLFNSKRWAPHIMWTQLGAIVPRLMDGQQYAPPCCGVAPVLYRGPFDTEKVDLCIAHLRAYGSMAAPGFRAPEGVVVYHTAANALFKKTIERDEAPKGRVVA